MTKPALRLFLISLLTATTAFAIIGVDQQMLLGNPSGATADPTNRTHYLINRAQYALDYNDTTRGPNWVSWNYTTADSGSSGRSDNFFQDTTLPTGYYQVKTTDYSGSGYDRGHMCPSADRTITTADNEATFFMSNMVPQSPDNNQGVWASFETYCRTLAAAGNEMLIISGPSGFAGSALASGVGVPGYTWKIAVAVPVGSGSALTRITADTRVIAIKVPNISGVRSTPWQSFIISAAQIETDTGYRFFTALPTPVANALRAKVDGQTAVGSPAITTQPVGQSAPVGGSATFTVAASGNAPLSYQWFKGDSEIAGATSATLTLTAIQLADADTYTAVVTNSLGSATSNGAVLVISGVPPSIVTPPTAKSVAAGASTTFSVVASGSPTLTYQWRKGGVNLANGAGISGATTSVLSLTNVQAATAGSYDVVVTNNVNSATSAAAVLTVTAAAPTIVTAPAAQTAALGSTATFTVVATGTEPLRYQWRKGGTPITGNASATTATFAIAGVAAGDAGSYDVVVSNGVSPDATSTAAALTIGSSAPGGAYEYAGGSYTQDFNGLPASSAVTYTFIGNGPYGFRDAPPNGVGATGLTGWSFLKYAGSGSVALFKVDDGTNLSGSVLSYGTGTATDRALGSIGSGSTQSRFGLTLINTTGQTVTQFTLTYTGEQWRRGTGAANALAFSYAVGGTDIGTGTFTPVSALDFTAPFNGTPTATARDGNAAANRTTGITSTVTGLSWAPGQSLIIRWTDVDDTGSDDGLGIDDLTFTTPVAAAPTAPVMQSVSPANGATGVPGNTAITVTFGADVTITGSWFTITSAFNGPVAATVTGGPRVFTLSPPINFLDNDTVTVSILASQIVDQATGTLHPAANTTFSFTTAAAVAPSISTQPVSQTATAGSTATFTVVAGGTAPFAYQWSKGGVPISGNASARTATLTLANVQAADTGSYTATVSNGVSPDAVSAAATLAVTAAAPTITTQPTSQTVDAGSNVTFTVVATGSTPMTYQWRKGGVSLANGSVVSGATTATLTLTGVTASDSGSYDVVVGNGTNPDATSSAAVLAVNSATGPQVTFTGGTYTQDFDTLPSAGTFTFSGNGPYALSGSAPPAGVGATGMSGWTFANYSGTGTSAVFLFGTGSATNGGVYSFGAASGSDRALGSVGSASQIGRFGVTLVNDTGVTITQFTLGYTGEQWRNGGNTTAQTLGFSYGVGATDINTGTFTAATALDFISPVATASAGALDGNLAANRTIITPVTITGISWAPGAKLVLRWTDLNDSGNDHGLAIDDLTFVAGDGPGRLSNLSIRTTAGADSATLIVGFVTDGGTQNSSLLVRAAGPALTPYGVTGVIANPALTVSSATAQVAANDDWSSSLAPTFSSVGAFAWTTGSADAALAISVAPAPYTAVVSGAGSTGIALAEIYEVNTRYAAANPRLVNVSARSQVGTGDNIMIAGFVITGGSPLQVLVRGVGPKLASYGVTGVLADPRLAIYRGSSLIASNDDWSASLSTTFVQVGAFGLDATSKDSALLVTLPPGVYTAQVSGAGTITGVALAEVYAVP